MYLRRRLARPMPPPTADSVRTYWTDGGPLGPFLHAVQDSSPLLLGAPNAPCHNVSTAAVGSGRSLVRDRIHCASTVCIRDFFFDSFETPFIRSARGRGSVPPPVKAAVGLFVVVPAALLPWRMRLRSRNFDPPSRRFILVSVRKGIVAERSSVTLSCIIMTSETRNLRARIRPECCVWRDRSCTAR